MANDPVWASAREGALSAAGYRCQARTPVCPGSAPTTPDRLAVHHLAGRGKRKGQPGWEHRPENLIAVHHDCHVYIHSHPLESYEYGWMKRRNVTESDTNEF